MHFERSLKNSVDFDFDKKSLLLISIDDKNMTSYRAITMSNDFVCLN